MIYSPASSPENVHSAIPSVISTFLVMFAIVNSTLPVAFSLRMALTLTSSPYTVSFINSTMSEYLSLTENDEVNDALL